MSRPEPTVAVAWDERDGSWRIMLKQAEPQNDGRWRKRWFPIRWLRFATREAAEHHLQTRGAW